MKETKENIFIKYKNNKLTKSEKQDFLFAVIYSLCIRNNIHFDLVEEWFYSTLNKNNIEELEYLIAGKKQSALRTFIELFNKEDFEYHSGYQEWFFESNFKNKEDLLKYLKISTKKIEDLFVVLSFNIKIEEHINESSFENIDIYFNSEKLQKNISN